MIINIKEIDEKILEELVKISFSYVEVCKHLSIKYNGRPYRNLRNRIKSLNFDTSHFKIGKPFLKGEKSIPLEELLVENRYFAPWRIKKKLISANLKLDKCEDCGTGPFYNGKPLTLELDHINGINDDNRIENLRILCPNCHSQTETYRSKKAKV